MKNWKFVQTGNKDTPELREKLRDLNEQIKNWEHAKGIDGVEKANAQKTLDQLRKERSEVQKEIATDNESIDKQEWSMFKGLSKDAEKEIGNESQDVEKMARLRQLVSGDIIKTKDGKVEIEKYDEIGFIGRDGKRYTWSEVKAYNSKTGNEDIQKVHEILEDLIAGKHGYLHAIKLLESAGVRPEDAKTYAQHPKDYAKHMIERRDWGNSKWKMRHGTIAEVKEDETVVYTKGNFTSGEKFESKEKAEEHLKNIGSVKTENADPSTDMRNEYNAEIHRLEKKMDELYRRGQGHSAMQVQKQIEQLQKELRELGNKKTGNEETKAERKFGKVMGEYKEGALKSSSGETVTDPAQAKAIAYSEADKVDNLKRARNAMKTRNRRAIGSHFEMDDIGVEVGPWSWDWRGQAPDKKTMQEIARKIKDYARQIDINVPEGDSDEQDEVFGKLDRFMQTQGLK